MVQLINVNYETGVPAMIVSDPTVPGAIAAQFCSDPSFAGAVQQVALTSDPYLRPTIYILTDEVIPWPNIRTQSQTVSAAGLSPPLFLDLPPHQILPWLNPPRPLLPGILVTLSSGASLTYNVEATGLANPVNAPGEPWKVADNGGGLTSSANLTLVGAVQAVRLNVTTYASGTATIFLVEA